MPPPCVILDHKVMFVTRGEPPPPTEEIPETSMETILEAMKPEPVLSDPPGISHISMVEQLAGGPACAIGTISSTDKSLVVLYAGHYHPGAAGSNLPSSGCYLVYDASTNSLHAVPQLPDPYSTQALGLGAAILSRRGNNNGAFLLAELLVSTSGVVSPHGVLYLWHYCPILNPNQDRQWVRKDVSLPRQVLAPTFCIDMAFSYGDSCVCWADLLTGVLICNLLESPEPEFTFVPLPPGCSIDASDRRPPRPNAFRTMGCCANGFIKFAAIVGYNEVSDDRKDLVIKSWALSPDRKEWKVSGNPMAVSDLWRSECFREGNLPNVAPSFPVICSDESQVIYVMLNDVDSVPDTDYFGNVVGVDLVLKARYMLSIDLAQSKVLQFTKVVTNEETSLFTELVASEFSAYIHGSKGCQEGLEAC